MAHFRTEVEDERRFFRKFLEGNLEYWTNKIWDTIIEGKHRIPLELRDLDAAQTGLARKVLDGPVKYLVPWEDELSSFFEDIRNSRSAASTQLPPQLKLDIRGAFGRNHVTPRALTSTYLCHMVRVVGVVQRAGPSDVSLLVSISWREDGDNFQSKHHNDPTAFVSNDETSVPPTHDKEGKPLFLDLGLSVFKETQKFFLGETPEETPFGQKPSSIEVICDGDLFNEVNVGERVQVTGVYRPYSPPLRKFTTAFFPARLIATNITPIRKIMDPYFVYDDIENIKTIAKRPDAFELLARSFAPSVCGHEIPKKGLLLQMIGGTRKTLANGTHLRGDIHVLLAGDPSCGKSQMLRFVLNVSPWAVSTAGRNSSGVGLTAAVIREPGSKNYAIHPGAFVQAGGGFVCIDEFDKMGQSDRVMIHEAMEQQTVTIGKAGLQSTLNAHCSVVAASNPVFGTFDPQCNLVKNIGLPDTVLSRFDLVFVLRDIATEDNDRQIAEHVVRRASQRIDTEPRMGVERLHSAILQQQHETDTPQTQEASEVFERRIPGPTGQEPPEVVTLEFLRKYIKLCRRFTPVLTKEAQSVVSDLYALHMRKWTNVVVTTRTLEALIRLSTAHAKLKLRKRDVLPEDVREAFWVMMAAREQDPPSASALLGGAPGPDTGDQGSGPEEKRGHKRSSNEAGLGDEAISTARVNSLTV